MKSGEPRTKQVTRPHIVHHIQRQSLYKARFLLHRFSGDSQRMRLCVVHPSVLLARSAVLDLPRRICILEVCQLSGLKVAA